MGKTRASCGLKMERAKAHLDALNKAVTLYCSKPEESYCMSVYDDLEHVVIKCESIDNDAALPLGAIAGDFICNLRSVLDHIAWGLAALSGVKPSNRDICFPITGKDSLETQLKITKSTYGIPEEAIAIMKSLQPYKSGDAYKSTHLWRLHTLWNIDKHRNVVFHSVISGEIVFIPKEFAAAVKWEPLDNGAIMRIPLAAKEKMHLNPGAGIDVQFGDDEQGVVVTCKEFGDMYDFVSKEVVPRFDRFFP